MKFKYIINVLLLVFASTIYFISCKNEYYRIPVEVEDALTLSGRNRKELEHVLMHYNNRSDSLKFKSACYLIANMPLHEAIYHNNPKRINYVLKSIGEVKINRRTAWDSLGNYLSAVLPNELETRKDIETLGYDFLVENIDCAFYAWKNFPWCKNLSFEDFKTYILPYRSFDEPVSFYRKKFMSQFSWLMDSMRNESDQVKAFAYIYNDFLSWFETTTGNKYPIPMNFDQLIMARGGSCSDECNLLNAIMRSMGIVSVIDHVSYWANRNKGHTWVAVLDSIKRPLIMDKYTDYPVKSKYLHSATFPLDSPADSLLPSYLYLTKEKKAAKVVRKTFTPNLKTIAFNSQTSGVIPKIFKNPFCTDVSQDYLDVTDLSLSIEPEFDSEVIYLCLFEKNKFLPVDRTIAQNDTCRFSSAGKDVLYMVAVNKNNNILPVTDPFVINATGEINYYHAIGRKQTMVLRRKYPLFGNILNYANEMLNGRFQGANNNDFSDAEDLYVIKQTPIEPEIISIANKGGYRYLRYYPTETTFGSVAEIAFYNGNKLLSGDIVYMHNGITAKGVEKAFDNKYESYYKSDSINTYIGIDLGENGASKVTTIRFCPRTDTNFIMEGNDYSLHYWDNGWKLFSMSIADNYWLKFEDVPQGTIYWLTCLNGGKEERPFSYVNGMQIWW